MSTRKLGYAAIAILNVALLLAILVRLNSLSQPRFVRWDLTETKQYSLSPATRKILTELDDPLKIEAYFSRNLPPQFLALRRQIDDLFREYMVFSKGKVVAGFAEDTGPEDFRKRAQRLGVPEVPVRVRSQDKVELVTAVMGVAILYGDKKETLPLVNEIPVLERDLTTAIKKVLSPPKTVGFLKVEPAEDEPDAMARFESWLGLLRKQYRVRMVDCSRGHRVPENISVLIVAGPRELSERDRYEIDQFLMDGGRLLLLWDAVDIRPAKGILESQQTNLEELFEHYGVRVNADLVMELDPRLREIASFKRVYRGRLYPQVVRYPFWPRVSRANLDRQHIITKRLEGLSLHWASSVEALKTEAEGLRATVLARTSTEAHAQPGPRYNITPRRDYDYLKKDERGPRNLAVLVSGKLTSFYAGQEIPKPEEEEDPPPGRRRPPPVDDKDRKTIEQGKETHLVVVGDSDFLSDGGLQAYQQNAAFALNAVDWLSLDEDLIAIRSKPITSRPLDREKLTKRKIQVMKLLNVLGVPLLAIAFGLVRFGVRRVMKARDSSSARERGAPDEKS